ncbi:Uncharacterised protein at_DN2335, partial [Pycnogonum litorale]
MNPPPYSDQKPVPQTYPPPPTAQPGYPAQPTYPQQLGPSYQGQPAVATTCTRVVVSSLASTPVNMTCSRCGSNIITELKPVPGLCAYFSCVGLALLG